LIWGGAASGLAAPPCVEGRLVREAIERTNPYQQAGKRYRAIELWERDDLIANLVEALGQCRGETENRMVGHVTRCDPECGARVAQGIGLEVKNWSRSLSEATSGDGAAGWRAARQRCT
jgi:catalase